MPYVLFYVGYLIILGVDRVAARSYHFDRPGNHDYDKAKDDSAVNTERELENMPQSTPAKQDVGALTEIANDNNPNSEAPAADAQTKVQPS